MSKIQTLAALALAAAIHPGLATANPVTNHEAGSVAGSLTNLALGKPYQFSSPPNYELCKDDGDTTQLTDGLYTKGYFWTQKSTVGWQSQRPCITIDLGAVQPIRGVAFSTAAGVAGVSWPAWILVLFSDDGKEYYHAGDLVALSAKRAQPPAEGQHATHRFWTDELATRGRFVRLVIEPQGSFAFVDEIEVHRGDDRLLGQPPSGRRIESADELLNDMMVAQRFRQRLASDLAVVRPAIGNVAEKAQLARELADINEAIPTVEPPASKGFRAILPFNDLHRRIFAVQAAAWRANGAKPVTVWQNNRWDMLAPTDPPRPGGARIDVAMMKNERRSAAFNLSNSGASPLAVRLSITGLPGGRNPESVSVREVPFTDTQSGVVVAAALPEAKRDHGECVFEIEAGMTRQVWLTFNSRTIPAGEYEARIVGEPGDVRVPVRLKVSRVAMPDSLTLHLGGWDYTDAPKAFDVTEQNRAALVQYLQEHGVDTPWATSAVMPIGTYGKDGSMTGPPDTKNFETWIQRWPKARNYYVFSAVHERFAGFEMGTPPFQRAVAAWINWWARQLAQWQIKPEQLGLLLLDEPHTLEQDKVIVEYAKVIREAQPNVVLFVDPTWTEPQKANPEMFAVSTTLCPMLPMWIAQGKSFADFYLKQRDAGKELWFYSCSGPGRLLDPYAYHRMQHWFCWKHDARGSCFWAFGDSNGASSWNEYVSRVGAYTPMFLDATSVTHGKHMEAVREGMQDYEYLRMLRDRIKELRTQGARDAAITAAEATLASATDRVTACMDRADKIHWKEPKDRSIADQVRVEVLNALEALEEVR